MGAFDILTKETPMTHDWKALIRMGCTLFGLVTALAPAASAQQQDKPAGPPGGLAVQIVNTPLPVHIADGAVPVTGNVTATVAGEVTAKIAPTNLFFQTKAPTCDLANRCFVKFPAVPDGKVLRVTRITGALFNTNADAFVALDLDNFATNLFVLSVKPFGGAYLGPTLSFNADTDVVFEAGQSPIIEMGTTGTFDKNSFNRLNLTGELIDAVP